MKFQSQNQTIKAAATGRLLLKQFNSWAEFDEASKDFSGNRSERRAKRSSTKGELRKFLSNNFEGATEAKLAKMWNILRKHRGIRRNMPDFEREFFRIRKKYRLGVPDHAVVDISLWGLGFDFPEKQLADSLAESVSDLKSALLKEKDLDFKLHRDRVRREEIRSIPRRQQHCSRSVLFFGHGLIECYLNGLAWRISTELESPKISNRKRRELEDRGSVDISKKLRGFDGSLFNFCEIGISDDTLYAIESSKVYRDSITHPSPFGYKSQKKSIPEFGKLEKFYKLDAEMALKVATSVHDYIEKIEKFRNGIVPFWLEGLNTAINAKS